VIDDLNITKREEMRLDVAPTASSDAIELVGKVLFHLE
jgi:hypothetical protein